MFHERRSPSFCVSEVVSSAEFTRLVSFASPWIASRSSETARRDARKELERFFLWQVFEGRPFPQVDTETVALYRDFLANPQPVKTWSTSLPQPRNKHGGVNPFWRPFAGPLSPSSVKQACSILHGFFRHLVETGVIDENPFRLRRGRGVNKARRSEIDHTEAAVAFTLVYLKDRASIASPNEAELKALRMYWAVVLLFFTGASPLELVTASMGDFYRDDVGWWLQLSSGGCGSRTIALSEPFLEVLQRYRAAIGLAHFPTSADRQVPLIGDVFLGRRRLSQSAFYKLTKYAFLEARTASSSPVISEVLAGATSSWLQRFAVQKIAQHRLHLGANTTDADDGSPQFEMAVARSHLLDFQPE